MIRQQVPFTRYVLGVPILLLGLALLTAAVSAVVTAVGGGVEAMLVAALGGFWLLLFAALTLPLGWWLTLLRRTMVVEPGGAAVVERLDWRFGRRERRRLVSSFRAVRVAVEPLNDSPSARGPTTWAVHIRLLPKPDASVPSFELGVVDVEARGEAITAARQIAGAVGLPLEVADADARLHSPEHEANAREIDDAARADEAE